MLNIIKEKISYQKRLKIKYRLRFFKAFFYLFNLSKIAKIHKTDKFGYHFYTPHYQNHFKKYKFNKNNILEIGVGGYEDPFVGGNSLRMWKSYFPFSKIYALDIHDKSFLQESRIKIFKGSQVDFEFLETITKEIGDIDLIIDDGSHINEHVIESFKYLFPKLKKSGIYVVEDTQTSYWNDYGGDSSNFDNKQTIYGFFKSLIDGLNNEEFIIENYQKTYYDKHIISMHFYHNMIFIYKGDNDECSNYLVNNSIPNGKG
ncbi:Mycinamicin VI 2''-O-methyltransferase [Mariniflexile rhizosphaerae]|uniref:class I SAM-dependent methyltransferase n=1 Tax=unclassified Mariniflexile TaxID=2643887 RepID=UPI000CAF7CBF|nr:class I SAM-dependent methyltransferase [Mariniflexile sp. TRM1-10]AXP79269.1 Mycinamicin VI 2''-O-methyltransferase [Mariniflexile sp. TRM1-10]PLB17760.1 MAG: Methyltransferase [Flavobacteriaceae bacterium FS1-H7996/R]